MREIQTGACRLHMKVPSRIYRQVFQLFVYTEVCFCLKDGNELVKKRLKGCNSDNIKGKQLFMKGSNYSGSPLSTSTPEDVQIC